GEVETLQRLIAESPLLVSVRLESPGPWLRERVGPALDGFFGRPFLLWFVAEDPVRNGRLPANIAESVRVITRAARQRGVPTLQEQLDTTLRLVCWSGVAARFGVQLEMIDALIDAGPAPVNNANNAIRTATPRSDRPSSRAALECSWPGALPRRGAPPPPQRSPDRLR